MNISHFPGDNICILERGLNPLIRSINKYKFVYCSLPYSARFPHSKRLEYYQSYIFLSPLERNLSILTLFSTIDLRISSSQSEELGQGTFLQGVRTRPGDLFPKCYSDYNNPTPINILFPLSDKLSFPIHQFPILII
ncbi:hypothetical protein Avbf_02572 [Armadillidium vulgare]|nr:hypothetical protein Avbf_02572 [Armadillidium vulgare]